MCPLLPEVCVNILVWHVHGSWMTAFIHGRHRYLVPVDAERGPYGLAGGPPGAPGRNLLNGEPLPSKGSRRIQRGDRLRIETPGAGAYKPGLP